MKFFLPTLGACVGIAISIAFTHDELLATSLIISLFGAIVGFSIGVGVIALFREKKGQPLTPSQVDNKSLYDEMKDTYWQNKGNIYPTLGNPDPEGARGERDP